MRNNRSYRELEVWKEARSLVKSVYLLTKSFPADEMFCLTQQVRRYAISIPSNIAEGIGRKGTKDIIQFLYISRGSLYELETHCIIAFDLEYISEDILESILTQTEQVGKLLSGFINYHESKL